MSACTWCSSHLFPHFLPKHSSKMTAMTAGEPKEHAYPDISRLDSQLQLEWDHAANTHLGSIIILPQSNRKAWWRSGMCKTGQPHMWQATIAARTNGSRCPYDAGKATCPCNNLAHNHPEVAAEWDWEANGERTPENMTTRSNIKAAWRCGLCEHSWSATVTHRTLGSGCPQCARQAPRNTTRQPSISSGAPDLLAEWDWEPNESRGWHPDKVTLGSNKHVHWVMQDECKLGLVHRWQASPNSRTGNNTGSPFPYGLAVCACNSLAVQCPQASDLWDFLSNGELTPVHVAVRSNKVVAWKGLDGSQWHQSVKEHVNSVRRHEARLAK